MEKERLEKVIQLEAEEVEIGEKGCWNRWLLVLYSHIIHQHHSLYIPVSIYLFIHLSGHLFIYQYMLTRVRRLGEFDNLLINMLT